MTTQAINADTADIPSVNFAQQSGDPAQPAAGRWQLFFKAGGLYARSNAGGVIGPFVVDAGQTLTIAEIDANPSGQPTTLQFPNGTLSDQGGGVYRYTPESAGVPAGFYAYTFSESLYGSTGASADRTSGASYTYHLGYLDIHTPFRLTEVKWDVVAGTYNLWINDVDYGQLTAAGQETLTFDLSSSPLLLAPARHTFKLVCTAANHAFRDCSANVNLLFTSVEPTYYDATPANFSLPVRLDGYVGTLEEIA